MSDLAERSKVNPWPFELIYSHCLISLKYQVRIMTKASTVFKKSTFKKKSHLIAEGSKFDLEIK